METNERPLIEVARETMRGVKWRWAQDSNTSYAAGFVDGYEEGIADAQRNSIVDNHALASENDELHARIAELEAQLAAHEAKRFHNGEQVMREYAARPVQGVE